MRTLEEEIEEETAGIKKEIYLKYQADSDFKVGDKVKVLRKAKHMELGWNEMWLELKDKFIGKTFIIKEIEDTGIALRYKKDDICTWHFPYFILEKVKHVYHRGQRFEHNGEAYILAKTNNSELTLINMENGNRWSYNVKVKSIMAVTEKELTEIIGRYSQRGAFELIEE